MLRLTLASLCLGSTLAMSAAFAQSTTGDDFISRFHASCVSSAVASKEQQGALADANFQKNVNAYCDCGLTHIQTAFTPAELTALNGASPDPKLVDRIKPIMVQCYKENFKQ